MNELQIFNNPECRTPKGQLIFENKQLRDLPYNKQLEILGALALNLALAARCRDQKDAWEVMHAVSKLGHPTDCSAFNALYGAVAADITWHHKRHKKDGTRKGGNDHE